MGGNVFGRVYWLYLGAVYLKVQCMAFKAALITGGVQRIGHAMVEPYDLY